MAHHLLISLTSLLHLLWCIITAHVHWTSERTLLIPLPRSNLSAGGKNMPMPDQSQDTRDTFQATLRKAHWAMFFFLTSFAFAGVSLGILIRSILTA